MTNEQKANELYPVDNTILNGRYFDQNSERRKAYIKGREDERAELSGTPEEAEEVLKPFEILHHINYKPFNVVKREDALKAMQTFAESRVAKYEALKDTSLSYFKQIQSLQQQLSEKDKEIFMLKQIAGDKMDEVKRQTAEVEFNKGVIKAYYETVKTLRQKYDTTDFYCRSWVKDGAVCEEQCQRCAKTNDFTIPE